MEKAQYLEAIDSDSAALIAAAASVPQTNQVAVCEGWTVRDLVSHTGMVWGRAADAVASSEPTPPPTLHSPPEDPDALIEWIEGMRTSLLDALTAAAPDATAWNFTDLEQTARWWGRRMSIETMLHRWDAESVALSITPMFAERAADAIQEYTEVGLRYSAAKPNRVYPSQSLHLHCTDTTGEWTLVGDDGPNLTVTHEHGKGDAAVRGQAEEVLLWVWGRPGQVEIFGDEAVAQTWQALAP